MEKYFTGDSPGPVYRGWGNGKEGANKLPLTRRRNGNVGK